MVVENARQGILSPELLTIAEVAQRLHAHPNSVRRWANQGLLRCYRMGVRGDRRFSSREVDAFLEAGYGHNRNGDNLNEGSGNGHNGDEPSDNGQNGI